MSAYKAVKQLLPADTIDMDGFPVKQAFPTQRVDQIDPFLLLHHAKAKYSSDRPARIQGVGPHPHRGFSPVTFVVEGEVHHRDSRGHNQIAQAGEVQWMHAGAGIIHSERPTEALVNGSRKQEIVQLWINSPAARKMQEPLYQYTAAADMPIIESEDGRLCTKLVAGSYADRQGPIRTESPLLLCWGTAEQGGSQTFTIPTGYSCALYLIRGTARINGFGQVEAEHLVYFAAAGDAVGLTFEEAGQFLLLCGEPIGEKVTRSGPYVMNTQTEILEAMRDYQMGKMGYLVESDLP